MLSMDTAETMVFLFVKLDFAVCFGMLTENKLSECMSWMLACWDNGSSLIARFIGPIWGRSGADRTQVGPMLVNELCDLGCLLAPVGGVLVVSHYSQLTATHSVMGTYRYYLQVHELHMSCSNFTEWQGPPPPPSLVVPVMVIKLTCSADYTAVFQWVNC